MKFLFCFLFLTSFAFAQCETKNHIFLIHGIGGSKDTFGELEKILNKQDACYVARSFEYATGSELTPKEFAKDFHHYVSKLSIPVHDKISLIMHSQGGLVGSLWLANLLQEKSAVLNQVDAFITLSTPFWGASTAHVGKRLFYSLPERIDTNPVSPFGRNELNEMSFGSATIHEMSQYLEKIFSNVPHIRPLAIAGMKRVFGPLIGEDDLIVPTYSMRPNRIYLQDNLSLVKELVRSPASSFMIREEIPFLIVPADHIRLTQAGVADIPKDCVKDVNCGHPSLKPILQQLQGKLTQIKQDITLSRFRFTMFVNNAHDVNFNEKDLTISVAGINKDLKVPVIERFTPKLGNSKLKEGVAFTFMGKSKSFDTQFLEVTLKYKKKILKTYTAPVEAGRVTFVDVTLTPEQ